ncbi:DUF4259 domain-containing protein [Streptomyces sp. 21So2-11]|uniref:DUF4259 domain-containing protein n=1 Tax=Streptomyces sp. 21So2-11 TaxID=3144408 RepID=UPI00321A9D44
MGTWGTGPFDSDLAADFVDGLEGMSTQQVIDVLARAFQRVTNAKAQVESGDGIEAVAAAALVASTVPDAQIQIDPDDGPREPLPDLPASLRLPAKLALQRILHDGSGVAAGWVDSDEAIQWRYEVQHVIEALEPPADHCK